MDTDSFALSLRQGSVEKVHLDQGKIDVIDN